MDISKTFRELGFSRNAALVYIALLKHKETQAGPIIQQTKLHRELVYKALEELHDGELVSITRKKNIKIFRALDPSILQQRADAIREQTKQAVSQLKALQAQDRHQVDVRTLIGKEGFLTNLQDVLRSATKQKDKTMRIIGGAKDTDFYRVVGDWYSQYTQLLDENKIKKVLLAPTNYSAIFKKKFVEEPRTQLRTLPKGLSSPTYTRITDELVAIEIYEPEIIVIQIRNAAVAKAYRESFDLLWRSVGK